MIFKIRPGSNGFCDHSLAMPHGCEQSWGAEIAIHPSCFIQPNGENGNYIFIFGRSYGYSAALFSVGLIFKSVISTKYHINNVFEVWAQVINDSWGKHKRKTVKLFRVEANELFYTCFECDRFGQGIKVQSNRLSEDITIPFPWKNVPEWGLRIFPNENFGTDRILTLDVCEF